MRSYTVGHPRRTAVFILLLLFLFFLFFFGWFEENGSGTDNLFDSIDLDLDLDLDSIHLLGIPKTNVCLQGLN